MAAPVLGIETSCDETAAAIVTPDKRILSSRVLSQAGDHAAYGGVVPEIAARAHVEHLDRLIAEALEEAGLTLPELDAIAATTGPGLIGGLMVGAVTGKTLALAAGKPFLAINHLEAHALSPRLIADMAFPYLLLLISGGHCQLLDVSGLGAYRRLGSTIDDAAGEAFDKAAKLLGLGYPGGPAIEAAAGTGDGARFDLPRPLAGTESCDFSFSGLKTALLRRAERLAGPSGHLSQQDVADLAAAFQAAVIDSLCDRTARAMDVFRQNHDLPRGNGDAGGQPGFVIAGGVAANQGLRARLERLAVEKGFAFLAPPAWLCTDNAAMIAWAGIERRRSGQSDPFDVAVRARWPLDETAAPAYGSGKKGAKA